MCIRDRILKELSDIGVGHLSESFNQILNGIDEIPKDWRDGKVVLLEKPNSRLGDLATYRPITVSSVLYRIFTKMLGKKIQAWMEDNSILGEMQSGFRRGRRGDDNLFVLSSAIEMSRLDKTGLVCVYLDCSAAYDRVNREKLWQKLQQLGMNDGLLETIQKLYMHNRASVKYNDATSRWIRTEQGLRQGCPLSCILFMLYISDMEPKLQKLGVGFRVKTKIWTWDTREKTFFTISGLLFADDVVLMARNFKEMEKLLSVMSEYGDDNDLSFNPEKSAVVVYSAHDVGPQRVLSIQRKIIPIADHYKYLGITLSDSKKYLNKQEEIWERAATTALHQMHAASLWGFNRFEISRVQWKSTAVPKLTYANAVLVIGTTLREKLEASQRKAGRWALGIPDSKVSNEFVEGELGWSSFEARDAQSKLRYMERVRSMPEERWPKAILRMMDLTKMKSRMYQETERLREKYNCKNIRPQTDDTGRLLLGTFNSLIKKQILEAQERAWRCNMLLKPSLSIYSKGKKTRGVYSYLYDNSKGSALLALARANMLPTRTHKMYTGDERTCPRCGAYEETLKHVIFECNDAHYSEEQLLGRLGLNEGADNATDVRRTKRILEDWDKNRSAEKTRA